MYGTERRLVLQDALKGVRRFLLPDEEVNDGLDAVELRVAAGRHAQPEEYAAHRFCCFCIGVYTHITEIMARSTTP